jgi:hypothetical protein
MQDAHPASNFKNIIRSHPGISRNLKPSVKAYEILCDTNSLILNSTQHHTLCTLSPPGLSRYWLFALLDELTFVMFVGDSIITFWSCFSASARISKGQGYQGFLTL